jgi:hypothetical protein
MTTKEIEEVTTEPEGSGPKELREALKRSNEDRDKYKGMALQDAFSKVGLDTTKGLGKAISKEYEGDPTPEALAEYAETEYGWEAPEAPENEAAPQIDAGNEKLENVQKDSGSEEPKTSSEAITKATAEGNLVEAGRLKAAKLRKLMQ